MSGAERSSMRLWSARVVLAAALVAAGGCEAPDPGQVILVTVDGGLDPVTDPPMPAPGERIESWASNPWMAAEGQSWLPYGPQVQLEIYHGLGREPVGVLVYISFDPRGTNPDTGRYPGLAAGDLARLLEVNEDFVRIWNSTNGSYYARVVVF